MKPLIIFPLSVGVEREYERQGVPPSCSIESKQSVSLAEEELWKFLEEQKTE